MGKRTRSTRASERGGFAANRAVALFALARELERRGDHVRALLCYEAVQHGGFFPLHECKARYHAARLLLSMRVEEDAEVLQAGIQHLERTVLLMKNVYGHAPLKLAVLALLGLAHERADHVPHAKQRFADGLALARMFDSTPHVLHFATELARVQNAVGDGADALATLRTARDACARDKQPLAHAALALACVQLEMQLESDAHAGAGDALAAVDSLLAPLAASASAGGAGDVVLLGDDDAASAASAVSGDAVCALHLRVACGVLRVMWMVRCGSYRALARSVQETRALCDALVATPVPSPLRWLAPRTAQLVLTLFAAHARRLTLQLDDTMQLARECIAGASAQLGECRRRLQHVECGVSVAARALQSEACAVMWVLHAAHSVAFHVQLMRGELGTALESVHAAHTLCAQDEGTVEQCDAVHLMLAQHAYLTGKHMQAEMCVRACSFFPAIATGGGGGGSGSTPTAGAAVHVHEAHATVLHALLRTSGGRGKEDSAALVSVERMRTRAEAQGLWELAAWLTWAEGALLWACGTVERAVQCAEQCVALAKRYRLAPHLLAYSQCLLVEAGARGSGAQARAALRKAADIATHTLDPLLAAHVKRAQQQQQQQGEGQQQQPRAYADEWRRAVAAATSHHMFPLLFAH